MFMVDSFGTRLARLLIPGSVATLPECELFAKALRISCQDRSDQLIETAVPAGQVSRQT